MEHLRSRFRLSERRACRLVGQFRTVQRYRGELREPEGFRGRMLELAAERRRFGYPRIHVLLRREGFAVNKKRTYRIYREESLQVRRKRRKRVAPAPREAMPVPERANELWSMDFMSDYLADGRSIRLLNVIDDCTRVNVAMEVALSLPAERSLDDAKKAVGAWRRDYNEVRPHSSLGHLPPATYVASGKRPRAANSK